MELTEWYLIRSAGRTCDCRVYLNPNVQKELRGSNFRGSAAASFRVGLQAASRLNVVTQKTALQNPRKFGHMHRPAPCQPRLIPPRSHTQGGYAYFPWVAAGGISEPSKRFAPTATDRIRSEGGVRGRVAVGAHHSPPAR